VSGASEQTHGEEKPAQRRLSFFWRHSAFIALLLVAAPLTAAFCWHTVLASLLDDSVSYITLARHLSPFHADPLLEPWTRYMAHFPPLFPLLLAVTGASDSFLAAHLVVGACAVAALVLTYAYANLELGSPRAGFLVALLFIATPGAWVSVLGILSEPLFLALSLAALIHHERRAEKGGMRDAVVLGVLLAAACLTRAAGTALLAAYTVQVTLRAIGRRELPRLAALVPIAMTIALQLAWRALRPQPDHDVYAAVWGAVADRWLHDPDVLRSAWDSLFGGWVATFTGESDVGASMRIAFGALGAFALAGAIGRARHNRLDGWYVLASGAMLFVYTFPESSMRRLVYPLVPVLLVHAGLAVRAAASRLAPRAGLRPLLVGWSLAFLLTLPGTLLVASRSMDREPIVPGLGYSAASTSNYYATLNGALALYAAKQNVVTLAGLELARRATPPQSRVMWTRTEYVALLARRTAVPMYTRWDAGALARNILDSRTDYVVAARLYKSDLSGLGDDVFTPLVSATPPYLKAVLALSGPAGPNDFVLFAVDRDALERYLAGAR
jgi:hypothetical protein